MCEKYLAPPARPEPRPYPPAVLGSAPPVKLGRRVEAYGVRPVQALTADAVLDFGNEALSYFTVRALVPAAVVKLRAAVLIDFRAV